MLAASSTGSRTAADLPPFSRTSLSLMPTVQAPPSSSLTILMLVRRLNLLYSAHQLTLAPLQTASALRRSSKALGRSSRVTSSVLCLELGSLPNTRSQERPLVSPPALLADVRRPKRLESLTRCRRLAEKLAMCASTVSSKMLRAMAKKEEFVFRDTLTGFK
jgi:hypothetical protein